MEIQDKNLIENYLNGDELSLELLVKKYLPKVDIHLSTQANTTNWQAAKFWHDLGIKRIIKRSGP